MSYNVLCSKCGQEFVLDVTDEQVTQWRTGMLIQRAMPNLTAAERELLISGYCGECFDALFPKEEEPSETIQ